MDVCVVLLDRIRGSAKPSVGRNVFREGEHVYDRSLVVSFNEMCNHYELKIANDMPFPITP